MNDLSYSQVNLRGAYNLGWSKELGRFIEERKCEKQEQKKAEM
jgi:hypothetical protein